MSLLHKRADRLRADFRKTFETEHGERVLMWLYERLYGKQSTFPVSGNDSEFFRNEGMRTAWLMIMEQLREEDREIRTAYERYIADKRREEINE